MLDDGDGILYNKWNQFREGYQLRILFLINFAGKAGTEKYVENLVRIFSAADNDCRLAYNISGELSETATPSPRQSSWPPTAGSMKSR